MSEETYTQRKKGGKYQENETKEIKLPFIVFCKGCSQYVDGYGWHLFIVICFIAY